MLRVTFHNTRTGDCTYVDTPTHAILVDCGFGPDYAALLAANGRRGFDGVIVTHAHADHFAALAEVRSLLSDVGWIAKSGARFHDALMRAQRSYEKQTPVALDEAIDLYQRLPTRGIPTLTDGLSLRDLNADGSALEYEAQYQDHAGIHAGCFTPVFEGHACRIVLGADTEARMWRNWHIAGHLPRAVDVLQAPNHGQTHGRIDAAALAEMAPKLIVISDADPDHNSGQAYYEGLGYRVLTTRDGSITLEASDDDVIVRHHAEPDGFSLRRSASALPC